MISPRLQDKVKSVVFPQRNTNRQEFKQKAHSAEHCSQSARAESGLLWARHPWPRGRAPLGALPGYKELPILVLRHGRVLRLAGLDCTLVHTAGTETQTALVGCSHSTRRIWARMEPF